MLEIGIKGRETSKVTNHNTAKAMESGTLDVYATPSMIALMEKTASKSVQKYLNCDESTVGTAIDIQHISPTLEGEDVWCESELVEVDGRKLKFKVEAYDRHGVIGKGTHDRYLINCERFIAKAKSK